jgi:LysM repeat protein
MNTKRTAKIIGILLLGVMLTSACTQTYSQTPLGTPTLLPTGLFVSPYPSGQDPLQIIADLGTQTAQAQTAAAGGGTTVAVSGTPGTPVGTSGTPSGGAASATPGAGTGTATQEATLIAVTVIPGGSTFTPTGQAGSTAVVVTYAPGTVPSTYTLQKGEWPYCIARRFNVNPTELLNRSGLSDAESNMLMPGRTLTIPQTGNPFPADRAWHNHPASYTVTSSDTTINGVACWYGDISPQQVATANNLSLSSTLNSGQVLTIP